MSLHVDAAQRLRLSFDHCEDQTLYLHHVKSKSFDHKGNIFTCHGSAAGYETGKVAIEGHYYAKNATETS